MSSLQLSYVLRTCAQGALNRAKLALEFGNLFDLPVIKDPNTGRVILGSRPCVDYITETYAKEEY
jgi:hypothetical protein